MPSPRGARHLRSWNPRPIVATAQVGPARQTPRRPRPSAWELRSGTELDSQAPERLLGISPAVRLSLGRTRSGRLNSAQASSDWTSVYRSSRRTPTPPQPEARSRSFYPPQGSVRRCPIKESPLRGHCGTVAQASIRKTEVVYLTKVSRGYRAAQAEQTGRRGACPVSIRGRSGER
jgi:hypothetical protein